MEMTWEHTQHIRAGTQPVAYHAAGDAQVVQVLYVDPADTFIHLIEADTTGGMWESRSFSLPFIAGPDASVHYLRLVCAPDINVYVMWESDDRHRLAVLNLIGDASANLVSGTVEFRADDPGVTLHLELANPANHLAWEQDAVLSPGARINLFFAAGSSERYPMGVFFVDYGLYRVAAETTVADARNTTGKLLKDQTVDEHRDYPGAADEGPLSDVLKDLLDNASVTLYRIENDPTPVGMAYPPNMTFWAALEDLLTVAPDWRVEERHDGIIVIGSPGFYEFTPRGTYQFERGGDVFSREILREDRGVYARVCVHDRDFTFAEYRDVDFIEGWALPRQKTYYHEVPRSTPGAQVDAVADALAVRLASVGVVETFVGPWRPHIVPGDMAQIVQPPPMLIGMITQVRHRFGRDGYYTEFTVDSGGTLSKARLSDFVEAIVDRARLDASERRFDP